LSRRGKKKKKKKEGEATNRNCCKKKKKVWMPLPYKGAAGEGKGEKMKSFGGEKEKGRKKTGCCVHKNKSFFFPVGGPIRGPRKEARQRPQGMKKEDRFVTCTLKEKKSGRTSPGAEHIEKQIRVRIRGAGGSANVRTRNERKKKKGRKDRTES